MNRQPSVCAGRPARGDASAAAKSGLQFFWDSLTWGLVWAILMVAYRVLWAYFAGRDYNYEAARSDANTYFVIGMCGGLFGWVKGAAFGCGRRARD